MGYNQTIGLFSILCFIYLFVAEFLNSVFIYLLFIYLYNFNLHGRYKHFNSFFQLGLAH